MKSLKKILLIVLLLAGANTSVFSQEYGTMNFWGKTTKLNRSFFEIINSNYESFLQNKAKTWKYYDYKDYNEIYGKLIDRLKSRDFNIIVDEANRLSYFGAVELIPTSDGKARTKKSEARVGFILYEVLLPSLQQFEKSK